MQNAHSAQLSTYLMLHTHNHFSLSFSLFFRLSLSICLFIFIHFNTYLSNYIYVFSPTLSDMTKVPPAGQMRPSSLNLRPVGIFVTWKYPACIQNRHQMTKKTKDGFKKFRSADIKVIKKLRPVVKFIIEIWPANKKVWPPLLHIYISAIFFYKFVNEIFGNLFFWRLRFRRYFFIKWTNKISKKFSCFITK